MTRITVTHGFSTASPGTVLVAVDTGESQVLLTPEQADQMAALVIDHAAKARAAQAQAKEAGAERLASAVIQGRA